MACFGSCFKRRESPAMNIPRLACCYEYRYVELAAATDNFNQRNLLGQGGFGKVYHGRLTGQDVAIKVLNPQGSQGRSEFDSEINTLARVSHPNLVRLIGYCRDPANLAVIYEFMVMGSLNRYLFNLKPDDVPLNWETRMRIAAGAASALSYLHVEVEIIHRDLKSSNILLGYCYHPKMSDFGLARLAANGHITAVAGSRGYMSMEYLMTGRLTYQSDMFSFGVLLLEIISGKIGFDPSRAPDEEYLIAWAKPLLQRCRFSSIVDPLLGGNYPPEDLNKVLSLVALCLEKPKDRPTAAQVAFVLDDIVNAPSSPSIPPSTSPIPPSTSSASERRRKGKEIRIGPSSNSNARGDSDLQRRRDGNKIVMG